MNTPIPASHARLRQLFSQEQLALFERVSSRVKEDPAALDNRSPSHDAEKEGVLPNV